MKRRQSGHTPRAPGATDRRGALLVRVLLAAPLLFGCDAERAAPPRWIPLAGRLAVADASGAFRLPWAGGREVAGLADDEGLELRIPLRREDWEHVPAQDGWRTPLELHLPKRRKGTRIELTTPDGPVPRAELATVRDGASLAGFALYKRMLLLGGVAEPPAEATLVCRIAAGVSGGGGRVVGRDYSGEGLALRSGASASCTLDLPPDGALRFATLVDPVLIAPGGAAQCTFEVRLDGELLYHHEDRWSERARPVWHSVPLPTQGRRAARLELSVTGTLANAAFLAPGIGPAAIGRRGARPWGDARPDLVLLLADTFRADNLGAYGGTSAVTPQLDALAARSLCFTRAWSSSSWTMPAHATIFTGLYPFQVRVVGETHVLPREAETVIEQLQAAGYRTAALTDGGFVSGEFGLDQGFAFFSERTRELSDKLAEARDFLAADDGRPVCLFVQTYRVHWPYRSSAETLREHGERLGIQGSVHEVLEQLLVEAREQGHVTARYMADLTRLERTPRVLELAAALRAHYLGGVVDLDRGFGAFAELLRGNGMLDSGYLVFTSDHGEAFAEHGSFFHSREPFEEQTRIPLLITGRGLAAGRSDEPVSLLDLAPTLAELAGLSAPRAWSGRSLLARGGSRALFSFQATGTPDDAFSVVQDDKKALCVIGHGSAAEARLVGAFDLAQDAREEHALGADARWPRELLAAQAAALERALAPLLRAEAAQVDHEKAAELRELGY